MNRIISRNVIIRSDGTDRKENIKTKFDKFENEDAIILLGDPGMGKTTLLKQASNDNLLTVREFLINPK